MWTTQDLDAIEVEKLHELHRRAREVDTVEIHRGARIRTGIDDVGADAADGELAETGVLRKGDRWRQRRPFAHGAGAQAREVGVRHGGDGHRNRLHVALAGLCGRHDRFLEERHAKREGGGDPSGGWHVHRTTRPLESGEFDGDLVVAFGKVRKREVAIGAGVGRALDDTPDRHASTGQPRTGLTGDRSGHVACGLRARGRRPAQQRQDRGGPQNPQRHPRMLISFRQMFRVHHGWRCAVLAALLGLCAASSEAAPAARQVLLLQSFERGILVNDHITANLRVDLEQRIGGPVNIVQVVVSPAGFVGAPEQTIVDYIRAMYTARPKPDLIVTMSGPAAVFARKHRQQLFPDTPLLFASLDQRFLRDAPLQENETAVAVANDIPQLIDEILQLLPETRQVFMVTGSDQLSAFWHRELDKDFARFHDRLTFSWSDDLSLEEIVRHCASLPSHSAIFYLTFGTDAAGGNYADERVLADLHTAANAPLFSLQSVMLGTGIVGGTLMANDQTYSQHHGCGHSTLERRTAAKRPHPNAVAGSTALRLARAAAMGHSRESFTAGERRPLSGSEPVEATGARCWSPSAWWPSNRS